MSAALNVAARALLDRHRPLLGLDKAQVREVIVETGIDADTAAALRLAAGTLAADHRKYLLLADRIEQLHAEIEGDQP